MKEIQKSQNVRLMDMLFIAPFLIYIAFKGSINSIDILILFLLGVLTFAYNAKNYFLNLKTN